MALVKGEQAAFGPNDEADAPHPDRPAGAGRSEARRRGSGVFRRLLLAGSLASVCLFALTALMPCGAGARPGFLPRELVAAACARQDVFGQILTLQQRLHAIAMALR